MTAVLIVEEQEQLRRQWTWLLQTSGFTASAVAELGQARDAVPSANAVLVHVDLPCAAKKSAFRAWRELWPDVVIIEVASPDGDGASGADVCIVPPFTADWLAARLEGMIRGNPVSAIS